MAVTSMARVGRWTLVALILTAAVSAQTGANGRKKLDPPVPPAAVVEEIVVPQNVPPPPEVRPPEPLPKIDVRATAKDLLPVAPRAARKPVYTGDDLMAVPELQFEAKPKEALKKEQWQRRKAHTAAAALHLNAKSEDGFLKAFLGGRVDLSGLPFAMGDACRTKRRAAALFKSAAGVPHHTDPETVVEDDEQIEPFTRAQLAVLRQRMGAEDVDGQRSTLKYIGGVPLVEATRELARIAVFSPHKAVRKDAIKALSVRREKDYTAVLVEALSYPWPEVARNAAEAIVKLDRKDLMPNLIDVLEAADPRAPRTDEVAGKKVTTARELVRVNHHANCLLCHAPAEHGKVEDEVLVAEVPLPSEPLPSPEQGYGRTGSNLLVRIDVTYLRQDFSVLQSVDEKGPWPAKQRFDFLVRKRELTAAEAEELRGRLEKREPGVLSPYQKAVVSALREMTGRDFEAKAEPWRRHLKLKGS